MDAWLGPFAFGGVELFFVLSGFLITGILLDAKGKPRYFRSFYAKRALRIWPLYYLLLFFAFVVLPVLVAHAHLHLLQFTLFEGRSKLVYILLLQNLWYPTGEGAGVLAMTWSLAIEEQFYAVWPWLVLLFSRRRLSWILGVIFVASPFIRWWAKSRGVSGSEIYFVTWFQLDGLSLGGLLALYCRSARFSLPQLKWLAIAGMGIGLPAVLWLQTGHSAELWPLWHSVVALTSAGFVAFATWCSRTQSTLGSPLRVLWLRYVGQISYCLYLIHVPVYIALSGKFVRDHIGNSTEAAIFVMVLGLVGSLVIGSLSWYLFESQILKLKPGGSDVSAAKLHATA